MTYEPFTWVDDDGSGTTGTLYTATRMNAIEQGVKNADVPLEHDAVSSSGSFTATKSWTHTPNARQPRGILVMIDATLAVADEISSVEYGGVQMEEVPGSPFINAEGAEDSVMHVFFLGKGVPNGAQQVTVTCSAATNAKAGVAFSIAADTDLRVEGNAMKTSSSASTSKIELSRTASVSNPVLMYAMLHSGNEAVGTVTASTGTMLAQFDFGVATAHWSGFATPTSGERTLTFAQAADEGGAVALQIGKVCNFGLVTALPTIAGKGDWCQFIADKTNGVIWDLVYDGEGEFPWKKVGGPPLIAQSNEQRSLTNKTTYESLATDPLKLVAPLKGDYDIEIQAGQVLPATLNAQGLISYAIGATAASDNWSGTCNNPTSTSKGDDIGKKTRQLAVAKSAEINEKARTVGNYTVSWARRRLIVDPVRVV